MTTAGRPTRKILEELAVLAAREAGSRTTADEIVGLARDSLDCDYAGLTLVRGERLQTVAPTDPVVEQADALQYELREGPCYHAALSQATVVSNSVASDDRWPSWGAQATALGLSSVLAARLGTEDRALGALNLYATRPQAFSSEDVSFADVFAFHATAALARAEQVDDLRATLDGRTLVGQAQGVLMERYGISASRAFGVLRRYAQDQDVKLRAIAELVIERRELPDASLEEVPAVVEPSATGSDDTSDGMCIFRDDMLTIERTAAGLRVVGEVDASNVGSFRGLVNATALSADAAELHLDLGGLTFIGVDGVRELARFADRLDGRELRILVGSGSQLHRLAGLCGWTRLLTAIWEEVPDVPPER